MLNMYEFKLLSISLLIVFCYAQLPETKICINNDCMFINDCPEAARLSQLEQSNKRRQKLTSALCDLKVVNGKIRSQVCCSDFEQQEELTPIIDSRIAGNDFKHMDENEDFTKHRNINLLPQKCGTQYSNFIIGGDIAKIGEFRWMAVISKKVKQGNKIKSIFSCGGTIITTRYILTAAHCVDTPLSNVRIGVFDLYQYNDKLICQGDKCTKNIVKKLSIDKTVSHDDYRNTPVTENDIALIKVKQEIDFTSGNFEPICLPIWNHNISLTNENATVTGWGITNTGQKSKFLQKIMIPILPKYRCPEDARSSSVLCAGEFGKDSCKGDSGGPLMAPGLYNNTLRMIQYGIVSYGNTNCGDGTPAVYTDVTKYLKWILDTID